MAKSSTPILVSACLLGHPTRYDGHHAHCMHPVLQQWIQEARVLSLCPEQVAGLPTPRPAMEIEPSHDGIDVWAGRAVVRDQEENCHTAFFISGAQAALDIVRETGIRIAVLKEGSPSCGSSFIADGQFVGRRVMGQGVTAAALRSVGVQVFSEHQLDQAAAWLMECEHSQQV